MNQTLQLLVPWLLVLVVFYLFLILPEQRKQKKFKAMVNELKVGDEILTRGGIHGKIVNIKDEYMVIESGAEKTRIKMLKSALSSVLSSKEDNEK
ncbi:MAG: preprotein translocase subunit YajC [Clostridiales bacterium]|nr:preprotein translocase subunit YajC [Clostridiales bacterium]HBM81968.1 preprotein translocase subunit YajC [Clostridiaceae bacterium]